MAGMLELLLVAVCSCLRSWSVHKKCEVTYNLTSTVRLHCIGCNPKNAQGKSSKSQ